LDTGDVCDLQLIRRRSGVGVATFAVREAVVRVVALASGVILARVLGPETFGLYAIAWFVVHLFSHFSDVGLGDALVRKPGDLTEHDLRTVLTLHLGLISLLIVAVYLFAPLIVRLYGLAPENIWLIRAMTVPLLLASLRTVPAARLERDLRFPALASVDVLETLLFQSVAVALALLGAGVWSLALGAVVSSAGATITTYWLSPWRPCLGVSRRSISELLPIGVAFQLQCFVNLAKDNLSPTLAGLAFGAAATGYLNWARGVARAPAIVAEGVSRVSFPTYARVQNDSIRLGATVQEALRWSALLSFGPLGLLIALAPQVVDVVYTNRWLPALPAIYLFATEAFFATALAVLIPLLQATGHASKSLGLSAFQALITWLVAVILLAPDLGGPVGAPAVRAIVSPLGFLSIAVAYLAGTTANSVLALREARRLVSFDLGACVREPLTAAAVGGLAAWLLAKALEPGPPALALSAGAGALAYAGTLWVLNGRPSLGAAVEGVLRREEVWP